MGDIHQWSTAAGAGYQFTQSPPNGAPEGMAASSVNNTMREMMAAAARLYGDQKGALVTGGSGSAYTLTTNVPYTALSQLPLLMFKVHADSVTGATLNVNGLGAKSIFKGTVPLQDADLTTNKLALVAYNSTSDAFDMLSFGLEPDSGRLRNVVQFRVAGTFSYSKPPWLQLALIEVVGGGGAGGGSRTTGVNEGSVGAGGGSGGYAVRRLLASEMAASETVTVGAAGVPVQGGPGGNGGTSSFGSHVSASPGFGGQDTPVATVMTGVGGAGRGSGAGGDLNFNGSGGGACFVIAGNILGAGAIGYAGYGASGPFGGGAQNSLTSASTPGTDGAAPGAGGSGAICGQNAAARAGGNGAPGAVIVWEYER